MHISEQTKKILENYTTINDNIFIPATKEGEETTFIQICDKHTMIIAQASIAEKIENDICIFDLKSFLSTLSILKDPNIDFNNDHIFITDEVSTVKIVYGDPSRIKHIKKRVAIPETKFSFELKEEILKQLLDLSSILNLPDLQIFSKKGKLYFQVLDRKNPSSNTGATEIGTGEITPGEEIFFQRELLKMIPGDYKVEIADSFSRFKSLQHDDLEYIIALAI